MYVLSVLYSCAVVSVFLFGGKANLVLLTLFYSTLLALSGKPLQTDGRTDGRTEEQIHSLCVGWRNLPTLRVCWRNLFSSCAVVSVLVLAGNRFWLYILLCTWSTIQLWCCVSFFGSGGKQFSVLQTYLVYNTDVQLCHFVCCCGKINFVRIPYSHDLFSKISRTFFVK